MPKPCLFVLLYLLLAGFAISGCATGVEVSARGQRVTSIGVGSR